MIIIKTLIELFDSCQVENVVAGLRFNPDKIIYVGYKEAMSNRKINAVKCFFELREYAGTIEFVFTERYDFNDITEKLNALIDDNEACWFDLTGGKELVLAAMGAVSALRNVPMVQFNVRSGSFVRVKNCETAIEPPEASINVNECVTLHGGAMVCREHSVYSATELGNEAEVLWDISCGNCKEWNRRATMFRYIENHGEIDKDLTVRAKMDFMSESDRDELNRSSVIEQLIKHELLVDYSLKKDQITFRYKNSLVRQCLAKSGNILELYTYLTIKLLQKEDESYCSDVKMGVSVDWDGVIYDTDDRAETRNEIDIIMTRGLIPIFISCKNGEVHKEALYELEAVADQFGGEYAKKVLIATYVSYNDESFDYIKQRAIDMNITFIYDVDRMWPEEFRAALRRRV